MVKLEDKRQTEKPLSLRKATAEKPAPAPQKGKATEWPAEGPHAREGLINEAATPGSGLFSDKDQPSGKVDPGAG